MELFNLTGFTDIKEFKFKRLGDGFYDCKTVEDKKHIDHKKRICTLTVEDFTGHVN